MKARTFNAVMPGVNEQWASNVLGIPRNLGKGIDLLDENVGIEIKFTLNVSNPSWKALGYQMAYENTYFDRTLYWGLGTYELDCSVKEIRVKTPAKLEEHVVKRGLVIVPWDWMRQFKFYHQKGKTNISEWDNEIAFAKSKLLPKQIHGYNLDSAYVSFSDGVDLSKFSRFFENISVIH